MSNATDQRFQQEGREPCLCGSRYIHPPPEALVVTTYYSHDLASNLGSC